ncbi:MAG: DUF4350 domain-containing protein [Acidobacteriota bacterium]
MSKGMTVASRFKLLQVSCIVFLLSPAILAQQMPDTTFDTRVEKAAYSRNHPTVVIDEAHSNFHTAEGRYKPFADLLKNDGYQIVRGTAPFQKGSLKGVDILVISNASAADATDDSSARAFTEAECDIVRDWVRGGGSLLLIADHTPFGTAAENLASRFGISMGKGFVFDYANSEASPAVLRFSNENSLLGTHAILRGRDSSEEIKRVVAFTGQSLGAPAGASALLKLGGTAYESPTRSELQAVLGPQNPIERRAENIAAHSSPVAGRSQGLAMTFGKGRLVAFGEAAMFSAQVFKAQGPNGEQEFKMGMNVPGNDDRQLALNVLHWLSGLLK